MSYKELLLGAGNRNKHIKDLCLEGDREYHDLTTLDIDPSLDPDVVWDLNIRPLPFEDNTFDEIHAYDVLEHVGTQGDYKGFFEEFEEYWRILKPDGLMFISVPSGFKSVFSDPGHTRVFTEITPAFLSQRAYKEQVGVTKMTDYRNIWKKDFETVVIKRSDYEHNLSFVIRKVVNESDL